MTRTTPDRGLPSVAGAQPAASPEGGPQSGAAPTKAAPSERGAGGAGGEPGGKHGRPTTRHPEHEHRPFQTDEFTRCSICWIELW
jgi:hypothetical protein